jgi:hypothetical protein
VEGKIRRHVGRHATDALKSPERLSPMHLIDFKGALSANASGEVKL